MTHPFKHSETEFVYMSAVANHILYYKYAMGFNSILTFARIFKLLGHIPFMVYLWMCVYVKIYT